MQHNLLLTLAGLVLVFSGGCSGGDAQPGQAASGGGGNAAAAAGGTPNAGGGATGTGCGLSTDELGNRLVMASEANNYSFSSTVSFSPVLVAPDTELSFDWSALTSDFLGHPLDPLADIDTVNLLLWKLTEEELEVKLNNDDLAQRDLAVIATLFTENSVTNSTLFEFTSTGMALTPEQILPYVNIEGYDPAQHIYTVMVATGEELGEGTRMIQSFKLDPNTNNTQVVLTNTSTNLEFTVDLHSLQSTQIPAHDAAVTIDWSQMTTNGLGNEFVLTRIGRIAVGRYDRTPAELEANFLDLIKYDGSVVADELWSAQVPIGTSATLSELQTEAGEAFPGIDESSTWVLALFCVDCQNPAPWYLSFLTPCAP